MTDLLSLLARQLVQEEILKSFDVVGIDDSKEDEIIIGLVEKESLMPSNEHDLVSNGYSKKVELSHFPAYGRQCILRLKRRRWKAKGPQGIIQGTVLTKLKFLLLNKHLF